MTRRVYCVPCTAICPHQDPALVEAWKAQHVADQHQATGPLTKDAYFAPVPSSW